MAGAAGEPVTGLSERLTADQAPQGAAAPTPARGQRVPALMYHEITTEPLLPGHLAVRPEIFAQHIGYLTGGDFTSLRASDLVRLRAHGELPPPKPVMLTFDDGFADVYDRALPLMADHGITATLYVTTGWIPGTRGPRADGKARGGGLPDAGMLSWSQIQEIAGAGIEIGAHTQTHPELDQLGPDALRRELTDSKHELEDRLGMAVTGLSYPFGYSSRRVRGAARAAGYGSALAVGNRLIRRSDDEFALPRVTMGRSITLASFAQIVAAGRLPADYLRYRTLTAGWSVVRRARSALSRPAQYRNSGE
jgi:peptidoglycan/xylan/chitin deacetylase (PgdA/CDA1 family)